MKIAPILIRTEVVKAARAFFEQQGFQEVITPVLNRSLPLEPNLHTFATTWQTRQKSAELYLSVSPEASLKKIMAAGAGKCFAISPCFRNLEASGAQHLPEFLMLEWYRPQAVYQQIMADVESLLKSIAKKFQLNFLPPQPWPLLSLIELFQKYAQLDLVAVLKGDTFLALAQAKGYQINKATWSQVFDQIFLNEVESHLPKTPFFLIDFPSRISPLCQPQPDKLDFAERFEVYIHGMELGNGNTENLNRDQVAAAFKQEQLFRQQQSQTAPPIDEDFLTSLSQLKTRYHSVAGIGLGIDRLAMIVGDVTEIKDLEII